MARTNYFVSTTLYNRLKGTGTFSARSDGELLIAYQRNNTSISHFGRPTLIKMENIW